MLLLYTHVCFQYLIYFYIYIYMNNDREREMHVRVSVFLGMKEGNGKHTYLNIDVRICTQSAAKSVVEAILRGPKDT